MPGSADFIQRSVHALEAGGLAVWVRRALVFLAILGLSLAYLGRKRRLGAVYAS